MTYMNTHPKNEYQYYQFLEQGYKLKKEYHLKYVFTTKGYNKYKAEKRNRDKKSLLEAKLFMESLCGKNIDGESLI